MFDNSSDQEKILKNLLSQIGGLDPESQAKKELEDLIQRQYIVIIALKNLFTFLAKLLGSDLCRSVIGISLCLFATSYFDDCLTYVVMHKSLEQSPLTVPMLIIAICIFFFLAFACLKIELPHVANLFSAMNKTANESKAFQEAKIDIQG